MKLSEAIRLGSMASEKCVGVPEDNQGRRCALGAALFAVGIPIGKGLWALDVFNKWPWIRDRVDHPVLGRSQHAAIDVIWNLNDHHEWSREAIADWVASIEPKEVADETSTDNPADTVVAGVSSRRS